jgi:hypothetical protein
MSRNLPKNIPLIEIQADLKSIEQEMKEVTRLKTRKERIAWAKKNPKSWRKIYTISMKYEIQWSIEVLEELSKLVEERLDSEKRRCEAILSRMPIPR